MKKFAQQAIIPPAIAVTGFVVVACLLLFSVVKEGMIQDAVERESHLAETIVKSARYSMLKSDRETLKNTIETIGSRQGVEHVRIFNKKGMIMFSAHPDEVGKLVDKKEAGCIQCHAQNKPHNKIENMEQARRFKNDKGNHVLAVTAPIYNEKACIGCHVAPSIQTILGTLDIGLSEEPLEKSLNILRIEMIVFCLLVGIVVVGSVSALLRRNVLTPLEHLLSYTKKLQRNEKAPEPPEFRNGLSDLVTAIRELARKK